MRELSCTPPAVGSRSAHFGESSTGRSRRQEPRPSSRWPPALVHRCSSLPPAFATVERRTIMSTSSNPQEVEVPTPTPALTPEQVVAHLRALQAQLGDVTPLTAEQRKTLRQQSRMSEAVVQA